MPRETWITLARAPRQSSPRAVVWLPLVCACALSAPASAQQAPAQSANDLTTLPFEDLLDLEVYSASRFTQKASEAPSTVTVITAADIRAYGWRTLADALRSVRGLYVGYDRTYSFLGARGFLRPGDYNTRFLLQIDGNRINDPVFDQGPMGGEFPLDLELVDRIEYVPGPGSSIYGANALFGVINVITKRAVDIEGSRASIESGSAGTRRGMLSHGWRDGRGNELVLSASGYSNRGRDLYFSEFDTPEQNHGIAQQLDYERGQRLFAKAQSGPFNLTVLHAERSKGTPTASFRQVFNTPGSQTKDEQTTADLYWHRALANQGELSSRLFWGSYRYNGDYVYHRPALTANRDESIGRWWGAELRAFFIPRSGHKVVAGAEFELDYRIEQLNYDRFPRIDYLNTTHADRRYAFYMQDEIALGTGTLLNAGLRYDHHSDTGGVFNPRLALITKLDEKTTLKAVYGSAYRSPNSYEMYYTIPGPGGQHANPSLGRERIRSHELALVRQLQGNARLTLSLFHNDVSALIAEQRHEADLLPIFRNGNTAYAKGLEAEYERGWRNGASLRASISQQSVHTRAAQAANDDEAGPVNSPKRLAKLNVSMPLYGAWRAGAEAQYVSRRGTLNQGMAAAYWVANLNLYTVRLTRHFDVSATVYNLLDRRYADPASAVFTQNTIAQDGRRLLLKLRYEY
ncbi:TonB-dependent siderophore receptor [Massilia sp. YIM B04103]|uniref:TonB-dependent receptor plug domain-containing protein n=1 Tax=Massilia sp. YIM B04103 TaxID=2963106 RepID=UPI00210B9959|nr:TonB-dependent receptor [Massilia sp. YIM B04103]